MNKQYRAIYQLFEFIDKEGNVTYLTSAPPLSPHRQEVYIGGKTWLSTPIQLQGTEKTVDPVVGQKLVFVIPPTLRNSVKPLIEQGTAIRMTLTDHNALDHNNFLIAGLEPPDTEPDFKAFTTDNFVVRRIFSQDHIRIEADLDDLRATWAGVFRPIVPNRCYHKYRSENCGYKGDKYWDLNNVPVTTLAEDRCNLSIKACELRFPTRENAPHLPLPFGGIPPQILEQEERR